ncbi:MAG: hypothetical protein M3Z36_09010 [Acidobacteriota bacterium]|nr:hypothetical protein [Acidobacteriota bacterium]
MIRVALLLVAALLLNGQSAELVSVKQKLDLIEQEKLKRGKRVTFTARELNAFVRAEVAVVAPQGVKDPRLELGIGRALGFARIDFLKVKQAQGKPSGWLMQKLLQGERPVAVTVRVESSGGEARVDVERVEISGVAVEGPALDFLIQQYVAPNFPEAKIGQPFKLSHRVERMELKPAGVTAVIGK